MQAQPAEPDLNEIQAQVVAQRFEEALAELEPLLGNGPGNAEALYLAAVCHRYLGENDRALERLDELKRLVPDHGRAHQEEGYVRRNTGDLEGAIDAFGRACRINPALEASFRARLELLAGLGRHPEAAQVRAQLEYLAGLPRPLVGVIDLISQGRYVKAEDVCRRFLEKVPHHVEAIRLLADIGARLGVLDDAEFLLESAVEFQPDNPRTRMDYIQVLRKRQKFSRALEEARRLLETAPDNPQFQSLYAIECMQTGDYNTALETFDRVLDAVPGDPNTLTSRGHALKTCGRTAEAIVSYREAIERQPRHGEAYYSLANLKTYEFSDEEIAAMHEQERTANLSHMDRVYLSFAMGKAYEDRENYEASFRFYARGNAGKKAQSRYDADRMSEDLAAQRQTCTPELFEARAGSGHPAPDPIFILGLPRAGSTLLEQILSSHSQVGGTLELPNILALSQRLRKRKRLSAKSAYPEILEELKPAQLKTFGEEYIRDTRVHRAGAPYFIDKMPNNFRHIGLIRLILPNAKIIDARRNPMACCFSAFKQLFAEGQEFSYDLGDLGRYYSDYVRLMDHWDQVLPGYVLRVNHEDVVHDLEGQVRRMLDFCGLPFEKACLRFHETERNIRTPSSEQVRQPIFKSALAQWKHYEPWLGLLKAALGGDVRRRYGIPTAA